jgi:hypothetical protein
MQAMACSLSCVNGGMIGTHSSSRRLLTQPAQSHSAAPAAAGRRALICGPQQQQPQPQRQQGVRCCSTSSNAQQWSQQQQQQLCRAPLPAAAAAQRAALGRRSSVATAAAPAAAAAESLSSVEELVGPDKLEAEVFEIVTYALKLAWTAETYYVHSWMLLLGLLKNEKCTACQVRAGVCVCGWVEGGGGNMRALPAMCVHSQAVLGPAQQWCKSCARCSFNAAHRRASHTRPCTPARRRHPPLHQVLRELGLDDLYGAWNEVLWALNVADGLTPRAFAPRMTWGERASAILQVCGAGCGWRGVVRCAVWCGVLCGAVCCVVCGMCVRAHNRLVCQQVGAHHLPNQPPSAPPSAVRACVHHAQGAVRYGGWAGRDRVTSADLLMAVAASGVLGMLFPDVDLSFERVRKAVERASGAKYVIPGLDDGPDTEGSVLTSQDNFL